MEVNPIYANPIEATPIAANPSESNPIGAIEIERHKCYDVSAIQ
jgi:hypothetical protein